MTNRSDSGSDAGDVTEEAIEEGLELAGDPVPVQRRREEDRLGRQHPLAQ
jgi:hypothetical protein